MSAGKFVLLLVVGGLAGAAFATMTSGVMTPYKSGKDGTAHGGLEDSPQYVEQGGQQSWLERGFALFSSAPEKRSDVPTQGVFTSEEDSPTDHLTPDQGAPLPASSQNYAASAEQRSTTQGSANYAQGQSSDTFERPLSPIDRLIQESASASSPTASAAPKKDKADDAAQRAEQAAQDVLAAEHGL